MTGNDSQRKAAPPAPTPEQLRAQRRRNVAIGLSIALLAILFYAVTIAKLGPGLFNRPL